jgi:hypothetical protein
MSDVPVYMVVNLTITYAGPYREYEKGFLGCLKNTVARF